MSKKYGAITKPNPSSWFVITYLQYVSILCVSGYRFGAIKAHTELWKQDMFTCIYMPTSSSTQKYSNLWDNYHPIVWWKS